MNVPSSRLLPALVLLAASTVAPLHAGGDDLEILQFLAGTGADPDGTCRARWRQDENSTDFSVELEQMDAGDYEVWVDGTPRGELTVDGSGEGEVEFKTPQDGNKPLLDFEVLDQLIEVKQGATTFFGDTFDGSGTGGSGGGGSGGSASKIEVFMVNVGPDGNAKGRLRHELIGWRRIRERRDDRGDPPPQLDPANFGERTVGDEGEPQRTTDFDDPDEAGDPIERTGLAPELAFQDRPVELVDERPELTGDREPAPQRCERGIRTEVERGIEQLTGHSVAAVETGAVDEADVRGRQPELGELLLKGRWTTIEIHEAGRRLKARAQNTGSGPDA